MRLIYLVSIITLFSQCKSHNDNKAIELNKQGLDYIQQGDEAQAIQKFKQALEVGNISDMNKTEILRNIAVADKQVYLNDSIVYSNYRDSAKKYFKMAASLNPDNSIKHLINMADVFLLERKVHKAIDCLDAAWRIDSNNLTVNNILGLIWLGEDDPGFFDPGKALKYNLKINKANNDRVSRFVLAKNYYFLEDYEKAQAAFRDLWTEYPQFPDYLITLILIDEKQGNEEQKEKDLKELKEKDPKAFENYYKWKVSNQSN